MAVAVTGETSGRPFGGADIVGIDWDHPALPGLQRTDVDALRYFAERYVHGIETCADLLAQTSAQWCELIAAAADEIQRLRTQAITLEKSIGTLAKQLKALRRIDGNADLPLDETVASAKDGDHEI